MMRSRMAGSTLLRHLEPRLFSGASAVRGSAAAGGPACSSLLSRATASEPAPALVRLFPVRMASTAATPAVGGERGQGGEAKPSAAGKEATASYWGVPPSKITKEDGTPWRWSCFMPCETYKADVTIDLKKHQVPATLLDKIAYWTVKTLRVPSDIFFRVRHDYHAMMLETVAAVPGMVGGMLLHLRSLRRFEQSGGWIRALLEEAENERMHLMTFMEVVRPRWHERALVLAVQGVLLPGLPRLPQVRPPRDRLPGGGGRPLLHRVPQGPGGRQDRQRPRPRHRHRSENTAIFSTGMKLYFE
ncbi:Ubiquinol oxidase [Musa troglodytarum]|uniref:Ubiquinol oxidase n=1 Tax=Musa troglodytarum TaxID=320322 RepID=A0A9E7GET0_9LILI|nr:Ubiquinol oxidase [Musa troglodytarum]